MPHLRARPMLARMLLIALLSLVEASPARADDSEIRSNRPGQSISAHAVGNRVFQVESGFDRLASPATRTEIFENSFRYGVNERFEVLFNVSLQWDHIGGLAQNGVSVLDPGFNFALLPEQHGIAPALALQTRFHLPNSSAPYRPSEVAPAFLLASEHDLGHQFNLNANLGIDYDGNSAVPKFITIVNFGFPLRGKLSGFVEAYGNRRNATGNIDFDGGFAWLVGPDLQLDLSGGGGSNRGVDDNFVSIGISWRTRLASALRAF